MEGVRREFEVKAGCCREVEATGVSEEGESGAASEDCLLRPRATAVREGRAGTAAERTGRVAVVSSFRQAGESI